MKRFTRPCDSAGWIRVATAGDVADESARHIEVSGIPLCLARSDGHLYAVLDRCSHQNVPLSEGEIDHGTVECWLHGSRFDLVTGRALGPPATKPVPVYPVRIDDDDVYVRIPPQQ